MEGLQFSNTTVPQRWAQADEAGRQDILRSLGGQGLAISTELLGTEPAELDALAAQLGFKGVWATVVDATGCTDRCEAVAAPDYAPLYRARPLRTGR